MNIFGQGNGITLINNPDPQVIEDIQHDILTNNVDISNNATTLTTLGVSHAELKSSHADLESSHTALESSYANLDSTVTTMAQSPGDPHLISWSCAANINNNSVDSWLIPFSQDGSAQGHSFWPGRLPITQAAELTHFTIMGDTETYNTLLNGILHFEIYADKISQSSVGRLVQSINVYGTNWNYVNGHTFTTGDGIMNIINGGANPDGQAGTPNVFCSIQISCMLDADEMLSIKYISNASLTPTTQSNGMELKVFTKHRFYRFFPPLNPVPNPVPNP